MPLLIVWGSACKHDIQLDETGKVLNADEIEPAIIDYKKLLQATRNYTEPDLLLSILHALKRSAYPDSSSKMTAANLKTLVYASPEARLTVNRNDAEHAEKYDLVESATLDGGNITAVHYSLRRRNKA